MLILLKHNVECRPNAIYKSMLRERMLLEQGSLPHRDRKTTKMKYDKELHYREEFFEIFIFQKF